MAARVHRRISLIIPDAPLLARALIPATDFPTAAIRTARAINPVLDLYLEPDMEKYSFAASIGLGTEVPADLDVYLDWHGGLGVLATAPVPSPALDPDSVFGAATAAVFGSAALFRLVHGQPVHPARFNPLELVAGTEAGTRDHTGPIDVGNVLVVGAGAVATALLYWARELGTRGDWDIVDKDAAELHNTNRCLTMTAADAGWPDGEPTTAAADKAVSAARTIGGHPHVEWYDQWRPHPEARHDLVLPLANGRGVRTSSLSAANRYYCTPPPHRTGPQNCTATAPTATTAPPAASPTPRAPN
jgi:hypothetical protein